ncbi:MAG: hypothetical protein ACK4OP_07030 [Gemmobacter sp.]
MKVKVFLAAAALALAPGLASAMCGHERKTTATACGEGMVFDAASQTCVKAATS